MALPPLTHHEILGLVEPFTRRGHRVDLAASDRMVRRLVFKPTERAGDGESPAVRERLELENPYGKTYRLTRVLTPAKGPPARLVVEGPQPGELLARVEAVPPGEQFRSGAGYLVALRHELEGGDDAKAGGAPLRVLTEAVAALEGLTLTLKMPLTRRRPADLALVAEAGDVSKLPEDLLAVVGWDWAPLKRVEDGRWNSKLRLRGRGPARSRDAEAKLERTARHLARTLAEPPRRFHERFLAARWWAVVRRTFPVLTSLALVAVALLLPREIVEAKPFLRLVLMNAPLVLIGLSFTLQEMSRLELPPWPRSLREPDWRHTAAAGASREVEPT
jgi:hypothetical protein